MSTSQYLLRATHQLCGHTERLLSAMLACSVLTVVPASSISILKAKGLVPVTSRQIAVEAPTAAFTIHRVYIQQWVGLL